MVLSPNSFIHVQALRIILGAKNAVLESDQKGLKAQGQQ